MARALYAYVFSCVGLVAVGLSGCTGDITKRETSVEQRVAALETALSDSKTEIAALQESRDALSNQLRALQGVSDRVTTLELEDLASKTWVSQQYSARTDLDDHAQSTTNVHGISDTSKLTTVDTDQTITGQKTFAINGQARFVKFDASGADRSRSMAAFFRYKNIAGPEWATGSIINAQGAWYSNAWMVISGHPNPGADLDGLHLPLHPTKDSFMIGCWGDVLGPCLVTRPAGGGYNYLAMDSAGNYVLAVDDAPRIRFGAGTDLASMDTFLERSGVAALHTNGSFSADGPVQVPAITSATPSIAWACSATAAGAMVYVDNNSDGAVSHMCFCGTGADDATYAWRRMDAPATTCP